MNETVNDSAAEQMWALYASSYDQILLRLPYYTDALARHLKHLDACGAYGSSETATVLDFGAGTGNMTMRLVERGVPVIAVDQSPGMLAKLTEKLSTQVAQHSTDQQADVRVICQTVEQLSELESESVAAVTCLLVLYAVKDQAAALDEAIRVLKPGGLLVITEPTKRFQLQHLLDVGSDHLKQTGEFDSLADDWARVMDANTAFDPSDSNELDKLDDQNDSRDSASCDENGPIRAEEIEARMRLDGFTRICVESSHLGHCATVSGFKR